MTENGTNIWVSFSFMVFGKTEFYIKNLHHYTYYEISVQACREKIMNDTENLCSPTTYNTARTLKKAGADDIKNFRISNQTEDTVILTWEQPEDPNGVIYSYTLDNNKISKDSQHVRTINTFIHYIHC